jgi:deoxyribose-phosphate aldolase
MQIAQEMLRASQAEESRIMASMLRDEFLNIEKLLAEEHLKPRVKHVIRFPYGTISLNIRRR